MNQGKIISRRKCSTVSHVTAESVLQEIKAFSMTYILLVNLG